MCEPASFVVTKDRVFWSKISDSHDRIIQEHQLYQYGVRGSNIVKVEISPRDRTFTIPLDKWDFYLDEDNNDLPEWFDQEDIEKRCRVELCRWAQEKLFIDRDAIIYNTCAYICGNSKVKAFNSKIEAYNNANVEVHESNITSYNNTIIDAGDKNYIYAFGNSKIKAQNYNHIEAYGRSKIEAMNYNFIIAYHDSQVSVFGSSVSLMYDNSKVIEARNGAIIKYLHFTGDLYKPQVGSDVDIIDNYDEYK